MSQLEGIEKLRKHDQCFFEVFQALFAEKRLDHELIYVETDRFQVVETLEDRLMVEIHPYDYLLPAKTLTNYVGNTTIQSEKVKSLRYRVIKLKWDIRGLDNVKDAYGVLRIDSPASKIIARDMEYGDADKVALAMNLHILRNAIRSNHKHRPPVPENVDEVYSEHRHYEQIHQWMGIPLDRKMGKMERLKMKMLGL